MGERTGEGIGARIRSACGLAVRTLARSPGFTVVALLILAGGVGANTAIFSLANWALFRPVPGVERPDELVTVEVARAGEARTTPLSYPTVRRMREADVGLDALLAYTSVQADVLLGPGERPLRLEAQLVTPGFFETLGVTPALGRAFRPEEGDPDAVHRVVVVSHDFWSGRLGGDRTALGEILEINGSRYEVVGVAPERFRGPERRDDVDLWVPVSAATAIFPRFPANILSMERAPVFLRLAGRTRPGVSPEAIGAGLARAAPELARAGLEIHVARGIALSRGLRERLSETLLTLTALVSLLLLLTVANLANLVLSRVARRGEEASVRKAMGASSLHLTADLLAEGLVLTLAGSVAAVGTGWGMLRLLDGARIFSWFPVVEGVPLDLRVLGFALLATAVAVGAATLAGAVRLQRNDPIAALRHGGGGGGGRPLMRRALVAFQVALSLALVVGAGLLFRSLDRLYRSELGFRPGGVVTFSLNPGVQGYGDADADLLFRELVREVEGLPGVEAAAFTWLAPLGAQRYQERVHVLGAEGEDEEMTVEANMVTPDFFDALGVEVLDGRVFDEREYGRSERPTRGQVVLNRALADALFPDGGAVGREVRMPGRREASFEVLGVVEDARLVSVQEAPAPTLFDPFGNGYRTTSATFVVRTSGDPAATLARIEERVRARDPRLPVLGSGTLGERVEEAVVEERALGRLVGLFAALALLLASAGLFGLVSESVQARRREFGVRTALGARALQVGALVLRESMVLVGFGGALGLLLSRWTASLLEARLFGMDALDPVTVALSVGVLAAATLLAALPPAIRSARLDPVRALRSE